MAEPILIDAHMHIFKTEEEGRRSKDRYQLWEYGEKSDVHSSKYLGTIDDALDAVDKAGFSKAVVVNIFAIVQARRDHISKLSDGMSSTEREQAIESIDSNLVEELKQFNLWGCNLAKGRPRLIPYVTADPWGLPGKAGVTHLRDMVENYGAKGLKIHPVGQEFFMSDDRMRSIYQTCIELGLPIIAHSGPSRDSKPYGEPRGFAEVLKAFPDLTLVLAHLGGGTWEQSLEIARTYSNAYFDCCEIIEWTGGTNGPMDHQLARLMRDIGPERVMMGSDFPWYDLDHSVERVMEMPLLSLEEKEGILGANALRILHLDR